MTRSTGLALFLAAAAAGCGDSQPKYSDQELSKMQEADQKQVDDAERENNKLQNKKTK